MIQISIPMQAYDRLCDAEAVHGKRLKKVVFKNAQGVYTHAARLEDGTTVETDDEGQWSIEVSQEAIIALDCK
jgi:hypothetical protein